MSDTWRDNLPVDEQLWRLIESFTDETATDAVRDELAERLRSSSEARRAYLAYVHQQGQLHWGVRGLAEAGARDHESGDRGQWTKSGTDSSPSHHSPLTTHQTATHRSRPFTSRHRLLTGIAASLLIVGLGLTAMHFTTLPEAVTQKDEEDIEPGPREYVATFVNAVDAVWQERHERGPQLGSKLYAGQQVFLASGLAEIKFANGAEVILQGPAEFEVQSGKACRIEFGKLLGECPVERSRGFIVDTPTARVEDLGTQFVVAVERSGRSEVHVAKGVVAVQPLLANGEYGEAVEVNEREAIAVGPERKSKNIAYNVRQSVLRVLGDGLVHDIHIVNSSFELPIVESGEPWRHGVQAWLVTHELGCGVSTFGSEFSEPTPHGEQMLFLNEGTVSQQLLETLAPDTKYTLSLYVGNRPGDNSPNYTIELRAGEVVLATTENQTLPEKGRFGKIQLEFICDDAHEAVGERLSIAIKSKGSLNTHTQNHFDGVQLRAERHLDSTISTTEGNDD